MLEPGERILFSKRDATAYFDTLRAPEPLQPFFGRPPLTVRELMTDTSWGLEKICSLIADNVKDLTVDSRLPCLCCVASGFFLELVCWAVLHAAGCEELCDQTRKHSDFG